MIRVCRLARIGRLHVALHRECLYAVVRRAAGTREDVQGSAVTCKHVPVFGDEDGTAHRPVHVAAVPVCCKLGVYSVTVCRRGCPDGPCGCMSASARPPAARQLPTNVAHPCAPTIVYPVFIHTNSSTP